jgi:hypothetical protein
MKAPDPALQRCAEASAWLRLAVESGALDALPALLAARAAALAVLAEQRGGRLDTALLARVRSDGREALARLEAQRDAVRAELAGLRAARVAVRRSQPERAPSLLSRRV